MANKTQRKTSSRKRGGGEATLSGDGQLCERRRNQQTEFNWQRGLRIIFVLLSTTAHTLHILSLSQRNRLFFQRKTQGRKQNKFLQTTTTESQCPRNTLELVYAEQVETNKVNLGKFSASCDQNKLETTCYSSGIWKQYKVLQHSFVNVKSSSSDGRIIWLIQIFQLYRQPPYRSLLSILVFVLIIDV